MKDIILFPFNGNAMEAVSVIRDVNRVAAEWNIIGFIDDDPSKSRCDLEGYKVIGGREELNRYQHAMVLAVPGRPENYSQRIGIIQSLQLRKERYATIVHPSASVGLGCTLGYNVLIQANVVLSSRVTVGNHVVILPNSVLSHGTRIEDYCLIGSNVSLSGNVVVGRNCYIGTGSKVIQEISIGEQALVGLGAIVIGHVNAHSVVAGSPARELKKR